MSAQPQPRPHDVSKPREIAPCKWQVFCTCGWAVNVSGTRALAANVLRGSVARHLKSIREK